MAGWPPPSVAHLPRCSATISDLTPEARELTTSLVLGSKSASRKAALTAMDIAYTVLPADLDERALGDRAAGACPETLVRLLGEAKGTAVVAAAKQGPAAIPGCTCVITGDQVVVRDSSILEKPLDPAEARAFIAAYSGGTCSTVGSCTATDPVTGKQFTSVETATLKFREFPDVEAVASALIAEGDIFHCAGGLMAENELVVPHIAGLDGTIDAILGLSPRSVCDALIGLAQLLRE